MTDDIAKYVENFDNLRDKIIAAEAYLAGFTAALIFAENSTSKFEEAIRQGKINEYITELTENLR
ncbi:unnamed protein product [marine sediment metagenome]|uniref:Uncharacterized protein n=1 Tax=marine sediment metagenome TaxID=412755 RepID=X1D6Z3_9ZZZZ